MSESRCIRVRTKSGVSGGGGGQVALLHGAVDVRGLAVAVADQSDLDTVRLERGGVEGHSSAAICPIISTMVTSQSPWAMYSAVSVPTRPPPTTAIFRGVPAGVMTRLYS